MKTLKIGDLEARLPVIQGGMGVAIAISIALFTMYWAFLIGGEDLADRGLVSPFWAMWSANLLLGGIGLYLSATIGRYPSSS